MHKNPLFSRRLAEAIARSGKKKGQVARDSGLAAITISRYLSGRINVSEPALRSLGAVLGVDPDWLAGRVPDTRDYRAGGHALDRPPSCVGMPRPFYGATLLTQVESLGDAERLALAQFLRGITSGDAAIRQHLIFQMRIIDRAMGHTDEAKEAQDG